MSFPGNWLTKRDFTFNRPILQVREGRIGACGPSRKKDPGQNLGRGLLYEWAAALTQLVSGVKAAAPVGYHYYSRTTSFHKGLPISFLVRERLGPLPVVLR
jgi:hypothetical protein